MIGTLVILGLIYMIYVSVREEKKFRKEYEETKQRIEERRRKFDNYEDFYNSFRD